MIGPLFKGLHSAKWRAMQQLALRWFTRQQRYSRWLIVFILTLACAVSLGRNSLAQITPEASLNNRAVYTYGDGANQRFTAESSPLSVVLIDPFGQVLGCGGTLLPDYSGFSTALYEVLPGDLSQTNLGTLVSLTPTELPDLPGNSVPPGLAPNTGNLNPFALSNQSQGTYNFLFDQASGQTDVGRTYILVITPPANSEYVERRVKLQITGNSGGAVPIISYRATSLDGQPISVSGATQVDQTVASVGNAAQQGLQFFAFQLSTSLCPAQPAQIIKSGDRAVAQPGDTVIYRVAVRNQSDTALNRIAITDALPLGFRLLPASAQVEIDAQRYPVQLETAGTTAIFRLENTVQLPVSSVLNLIYAVQLTPDAIRSSGRNSATVTARRSDNDLPVRDGPATHRLRIDPGLLSDCGTLIGRVFIDQNFDGEQQSGELGVPNAVVLLDDGNRITTDANGLFSVANVLPGYRTGVLDPLSIPTYQMARNDRLLERNSPSRLVHLEPGGLVRMNFAVMPIDSVGGQP